MGQKKAAAPVQLDDPVIQNTCGIVSIMLTSNPNLRFSPSPNLIEAFVAMIPATRTLDNISRPTGPPLVVLTPRVWGFALRWKDVDHAEGNTEGVQG